MKTSLPISILIVATFTFFCMLPANAQNVNTIIQGALPTLMGGRAPTRNGLPPTSMDSFVYEAKEYGDAIYGDEGVTGLPPFRDFDQTHRISTGFLDTRDQGLTTGHGSLMPCGVGADEFVGNEWSNSGPSGASEADGMWNGTPNMMPGSLVNMQRDGGLMWAEGYNGPLSDDGSSRGANNPSGGINMPGSAISIGIGGLPINANINFDMSGSGVGVNLGIGGTNFPFP